MAASRLLRAVGDTVAAEIERLSKSDRGAALLLAPYLAWTAVANAVAVSLGDPVSDSGSDQRAA